MKAKISTLIGAAIAMFAFAACSSDNEPKLPTPNEYQPIQLSRSEAEIVDTQNAFSLKFYNEYGRQYAGNYCVSPLSLSMTLSMLSNGATGETLTSILNGLGFESADMDAVNRFNARLAKELTAADNTSSFALANSIWINNSFPIKEDFITKNKEAYGAEIFDENFGAPDVLDKINSWCSDKTNGMIPQFLQIMPHSFLLLFNATYFKGLWATPFDKKMTKDAEFLNNGTEEKIVPFMEGEIECGVGVDGNEAYWLTLPYGNGAFRATFIIPTEGNEKSIDEYMTALSDEDFSNNLHPSYARTITVKLPKFDIQRRESINDVLEEIGFGKMLAEGHYSGINDDEILSPSVTQATHITVDETGTEAAAVTMIGMYSSNLSPVENKSITFDHPFAFIISEKSTGSILFMGRVNEL